MPQVLASWTAHPAKERPRDLALVVAVLALTAWVVMTSFESLAWALLSIVILSVAIAPFLLPTRYTVTEESIELSRFGTRRARRFRDLRRIDVGPRIALLSPFARPRFMDRYRGIVVLLDGAERDQVLSILRERIEAT